MLVKVRILGNLPYMVKGLRRQYDDLLLDEGARLDDLLRRLGVRRELLAFVDGQRLKADMPLSEGMNITLISPASGG